MTQGVRLFGYRYSAYSRVVRIVLMSKGVVHERVEADPFGALPDGYLELHPFGPRARGGGHIVPRWCII